MVPASWKLVVYGLVIILGSLFALPSFLTPQQIAVLPEWMPDKQVALGLDLRGGAHLVLEIDAEALSKEQLENVLTDALTVLRDARVGGVRGSIEGDSVLLRASTPSIAAAAERALRASQGNDASQSLQVTILNDGTLKLQPGPIGLRCASTVGSTAKYRNRPPPNRRDRRRGADRASAGFQPHPGATAWRTGSCIDPHSAR
jgi:preprotein translocase subunit SecD